LSLLNVMKTYLSVEFVRITPTVQTFCPDSWQAQLNFRQISFRDFVFEADIG